MNEVILIDLRVNFLMPIFTNYVQEHILSDGNGFRLSTKFSQQFIVHFNVSKNIQSKTFSSWKVSRKQLLHMVNFVWMKMEIFMLCTHRSVKS